MIQVNDAPREDTITVLPPPHLYVPGVAARTRPLPPAILSCPPAEPVASVCTTL